jgi:cholesterol oxidase
VTTAPGAEIPADSSAVYDFVVVGSGFGGSVSAMRLAQKGYRVLVLERGRRFRDEDFPQTNWNIWKYLWFPPARCFGILDISVFRDLLVLHGSGVGGGSLVYANVLVEPDEQMYEAPDWRRLEDWRTVLRPHFTVARAMLGVTENPRLTESDRAVQAVAERLGTGDTFLPTQVGVFFGEEQVEVADPYFSGEGPPRAGCNHCGACMVGCRLNAKNTLVKNYLYFAEKWGARIQAKTTVEELEQLGGDESDGARFLLHLAGTTDWPVARRRRVRARNVVLSAGVVGTLRLLIRARDQSRTLPALSACLGAQVRSNSEALLGATADDRSQDMTVGVAIGSVFQPDDVTSVEPFHYPAGSSLMYRLLGAPMIDGGGRGWGRLGRIAGEIARHPRRFLASKLEPGWGKRTVGLLVMQTEENRLTLKSGRDWFTLFRRGLVSERDRARPIPAEIPVGHQVARAVASQIEGVALGNVMEGLLGAPITAHPLGGCPMGKSADEGVVDTECRVFNYPGLYVIDGSIVPANPGMNPSLTITALAEHAMSRIPPKSGGLGHDSPVIRFTRPVGV